MRRAQHADELQARIAPGGQPEQVGGQQGGPIGDVDQGGRGQRACRAGRSGGPQPAQCPGHHVVAAGGQAKAAADELVHGHE